MDPATGTGSLERDEDRTRAHPSTGGLPDHGAATPLDRRRLTKPVAGVVTLIADAPDGIRFLHPRGHQADWAVGIEQPHPEQ
jgi:hypothetical protein